MLERIVLVAILLLQVVGNACGTAASSPEGIVKRYIQLLYANDLEGAKALCTPAGVAHLEALQSIVSAAGGKQASSNIEVLSITCYPGDSEDTYNCAAVLNDGFGESTEIYYLRRMKEGWRIDRPPPDAEIGVSQETITD